MVEKFVCIHGHFYQPPRENPWLEAVEVEDSAAPYHDWNVRVNAECYAANAVARLLDEKGRIKSLINNYEYISYDFGPTLLSWMEDSDPQTYEAILESDRRSVTSRSGHGNAIAQAYNHMILPLASDRDIETQVIWALSEFEHRFGRKSEGLWLPETAVDTRSLDILSGFDVKFVLLAPHQAASVRPIGSKDEDWQEIRDSGVDTTVPYLCHLPSGRSINVFFYNGPVSRAVAFEGLLSDGSAFKNRLLTQLPEDMNGKSRLIHIATDGESYGHHHRYGDMALAYVIRSLSQEQNVRLTNYGEFLELNPPELEVRIAEKTSWSCSHGVGRWSDDCGCKMSGGSQSWRKPLRESLNWLRDEVDRIYVKKAADLLKDPWEARNQYIHVIIDRASERIDEFIEAQASRKLSHFDRIDLLSLLEMQRHRMLMFTSCGWFFDDCAGIESVQILKYAARAIQLAGVFGANGLEKEFIERIKVLKSNRPEAGDGENIYNEYVRPSIVDLRRVVSHHAITSLFQSDPPQDHHLYCYRLRNLNWKKESYGGSQLVVGRVRVQSDITQAIEDVSFGLLHFGGVDFNCSLRGAVTVEGYDSMSNTLFQMFKNNSLTDVIHAFDRYFEGRYFSLRDLFLEGRRSVLSTVTQGVLEEMEETYKTFYEENRSLFDLLKEVNSPLPDAFSRTIEFTVERRIIAELNGLERKSKNPSDILEKLEDLSAEVSRRGVKVSKDSLQKPLKSVIESLADHLLPNWSSSSITALQKMISITRSLNIEPNLWDVQNMLLDALHKKPPKTKKQKKEVSTMFEEFGLAPIPTKRRATRQ